MLADFQVAVPDFPAVAPGGGFHGLVVPPFVA
jgi:hypothetical protein